MATDPDQVAELLAQDKVGRATRENLQRFLLNPEGGTSYIVSVDYGKSIEKMVVAGKYTWHYDNADADYINSENFPVSGIGVVMVALELVNLNSEEVSSTEDVLAHMEANGLRPATIEELLAFGATHPIVQREFHVICLGSSWVGNPIGHGRHSDDRRFALYLYGDDSCRVLSLIRFKYTVWEKKSRFLAVRK